MASTTVKRGKVRVVLDDECHEGIDGDYNPEDPKDIPLMRFNVDVWDNLAGDWEGVPDASYCTQIDARLPAKEHKRLARLILDAVHDAVLVEQRTGYANSPSVKKMCEKLSWINPTWITKKTQLGWILD